MFPLMWIFPPFIQPPTYMSALPLTVTVPAVILEPMYFTRVQSPAITMSVSAAVCAGITGDVKEVPDLDMDLAFVAWECCDLCGGLSCECVRRDAVALEHEFGDLGGF